MEKMHKKNIQLFALSYFVAIISLTGFYFFQDDTSEKVEERKNKTINHVLGRFTKQESIKVDIVLDKVIKGLEIIQDFGFDKGATFINSNESESRFLAS